MNYRPVLPFVVILVLLPVLAAGQGADAEADLAACNTLYHGGSYNEAVGCYLDLGGGQLSAPLLYNVANSYAQDGQTGYAVLYYLRALALSPGDSDIAGNLELLKKEQGLFPPQPPLSRQFFELLSLGQWSMLGLAALASYLFFALLRLRRRGSPGLEFLVVAICVVLLVVATVGASRRYRELQRSVVIADGRLLVSPFAEAQSLGAIRQGRLVRLHKPHGGYWYVTDETGRKGWLQAASLVPVLPEKRRAPP